jgi:hypothetical protein
MSTLQYDHFRRLAEENRSYDAKNSLFFWYIAYFGWSDLLIQTIENRPPKTIYVYFWQLGPGHPKLIILEKKIKYKINSNLNNSIFTTLR